VTHFPRAALITVQLGSGSSVYNRPFDGTGTFRALLDEARDLVSPGTSWSSVTLTGWSAGYGAIRAILRDPAGFATVDNVLLLDGIHASYVPEGRRLADGGQVRTQDLDSFERFAREAIAERKSFVITHSEVFPGTYVSTTEASDYLLNVLGLKRKVSSGPGPMGMRQATTADRGQFHVRAYSGDASNGAPDHIDHIFAIHHWLKLLNIN
jgi:hypothetical protein